MNISVLRDQIVRRPVFDRPYSSHYARCGDYTYFDARINCLRDNSSVCYINQIFQYIDNLYNPARNNPILRLHGRLVYWGRLSATCPNEAIVQS